jgi:glutathione S-transferase
MAEVTLFQFPGACSHVTMVALEETGIAFSTYLANPIDPARWAEYLQINPKGKIPALRVGDRLLSENAAILFHLHKSFPDARLLPSEPEGFGHNQTLQDLVFCSATLHPTTRMINAPFRYNSTGDVDGIKAQGIQNYAPILKSLSERFTAAKWWYGSEWSIVDTYLNWNYTTAQKAGLDLSAYPALTRHSEDERARPAHQRVIAREAVELKQLGFLTPAPKQ